ncbi:MAG: PIG-L family deacetylase [Myxococcota bacterium]
MTVFLWSALMMSTPGFGSNHAGVLQLELERLQNVGRVLYVAAHPDDENTRFISYVAAARRNQVAYLSITRGDGGQNRIGTEIGDHLGVIRSMELGRARSIDGGRQFFTRAKDFGYSKSSKESLEIWGHEKVLGDVVWVVRKFRPHVIVTRFPEEGRTHGHHLASATLAREAFEAAGDGTRYPEQLDEVKPWKATRVMYNQPSWWRKPEDKSDLIIDVGEYIPQLGMSIPEIAATSRTSHKSQGFGSQARYDRTTEYFVTVAGPTAKKDFFDGIDVSWDAVRGGAATGRALAQALKSYDPASPEESVKPLTVAYRATSTIQDAVLAEETRLRIAELIVRCAGARFTLRAESPTAVPGETVDIVADTAVQRSEDVQIESIEFLLDRKGTGVRVEPGRHSVAVSIPPRARVSAVDWLEETPAPREWSELGEPALTARASITAFDLKLNVTRPVVYSNVDPVLGEREQEVRVETALSVSPAQPVTTFIPGEPRLVTFAVRASVDAAKGVLSLEVPPGLRVAPDEQPLVFARAGEERLVQFEVTAESGESRVGSVYPLINGRRAMQRAVIDYPHLAPTIVLEPAMVRAVPIDLDISGVRGPVAYVQGTGDRVAELLDAVGLTVELVEPADLVPEKLERFHAVILGVRAFNVRPELYPRVEALLAFVETGGTLIVQYNTNNRIDGIEQKMGPYPFEISRKRVTDQTAPIKVLNDAADGPNRLTGVDFEDWVQERGLYFASSWDERYRTPFEMNDPGEEPLRGSTLVADYGKGRFVYTGISFFRQLPAGVPGAYRLLVNLLSR